jgi:hypothetical protein
MIITGCFFLALRAFEEENRDFFGEEMAKGA